MGKATVLSHQGGGLYSVQLDYGQAIKTARLATLAARLAALTPEINRAQGLLSVQQVLEAVVEATVQTAIGAYVDATRLAPPDDAAIKTALAAYTQAQSKLMPEKSSTGKLRAALEILENEQAQLLKEQASWSQLVLERAENAWCADLTEDATGTVATVEIPGENKLILISPAAPAPAATDGLLTAREVQSGPQVFWNAAALPGWQKWMPTYRRGVVTAVNTAADTVAVTLDDDKSSAQNLGINQTPTLVDVPVRYMTCNAAVFEVGDKCVVKFKNHDWAQREVVGFVDHPKACSLILSGVVRGGTLTALTVPADSPAAFTLNAFKPTQNCWQYPLRENPAKSPDTFALEPVLGKAGTQYASISPANYSGLMAQAVAVIMGQGRVVAYSCTFLQTHGITIASDGTRWLVEISQAQGALATRLEVTPALATSSTDAVRECQALFGGLPTGAAMPSGAALTAALVAGTVIQLAPASDFTAYFANSAYAPWVGWSISDNGAEWHNTCYRQPTGAETTLFGCHYKVLVSISKDAGSGVYSGNAALSLVAQGPLSINLSNGARIPFEFGAAIGGFNTQIPATIVSDDAAASTTPLFVCHQQGALQVINLDITARQDFAQDNIFTNPAGVGYPWSDWSYTRQSNRGGRRVYSSAVSTRDGTAIEKQTAKVVYRFAVTQYTESFSQISGWYLSQAPYTSTGVHFGFHRWVDRGLETIVNPRHARDTYFYTRDVSDENHVFSTGGEYVDVADWLPAPDSTSGVQLDFRPADATLVPGYTDTNANAEKYSFVDYFVARPFNYASDRGVGGTRITAIYPNTQHAGGVDLAVYSRHAPPSTLDLAADTDLGTFEQATHSDVEISVFGGAPQIIYGNAQKLRGIGTNCVAIDFNAASVGTPYKLIGYLG